MIKFTNVTKRFGADVTAVSSVSFDLAKGRTLALIGPSGCGKTTMLKMLNRLEEPTSGEISILGLNILDQDPVQVRRQIGYVIQRGGLFPHWTVQRNISMVPKLVGWESARTNGRVTELLELMGLDPEEYRTRYPAELSGGQQQRVGIARALAADPPVILFDEPFSALDPITRNQMQREFLRLKEVVQKTMVFVTHDIQEALLLGDEVLLLKAGEVQQYGTPEQLRSRPENAFVKEFLEAELN